MSTASKLKNPAICKIYLHWSPSPYFALFSSWITITTWHYICLFIVYGLFTRTQAPWGQILTDLHTVISCGLEECLVYSQHIVNINWNNKWINDTSTKLNSLYPSKHLRFFLASVPLATEKWDIMKFEDTMLCLEYRRALIFISIS